MRLLVLVSVLSLLVAPLVLGIPVEIKINEVYRTSGGGISAIINYTPESDKTFSWVNFSAQLRHGQSKHCNDISHSVTTTVYNNIVPVDSGTWPGYWGCGAIPGNVTLNNRTGDNIHIRADTHFGTQSSGFHWIEIHMPFFAQVELTREDGAKPLGEVGFLVSTDGDSDRFQVSSDDPDVMVWLGDQTPSTLRETKDETMDVYACLDTNFNKICDSQEDDACLNNNGDWYRGKCCAASGGDYTCGFQSFQLVVNGQPTPFEAWCGQNNESKFEWAAKDDKGVAHKLTTCPGTTMLGGGTQLYHCGPAPDGGGTVTFPSNPVDIRSGSKTHSYFCNISSASSIGTVLECAGSGVKWAGKGGSSYTTGAKYGTSAGTFYCAEDGIFTRDLDNKSALSCTLSGFTHLGGRCCSEADDPGESYETTGANGACWNGTYLPNGQFSANKQVFATSGTLQGCEIENLLPDVNNLLPVPGCLNDPFLNSTVRWWTGDGSATDLEASQTATLVAGAAYTTGKVKSAFDLRPAGAHLSASDASALNIVGDMTVDAWIRFPTDYPGGNRTIVSKGQSDGALTYEFLIIPSPTAGKQRLAFKARAGTTERLVWAEIDLDTQWHHVAATRRGSQIEFYFDGVELDASGSFSITEVASPGLPLLIGASTRTAGIFNTFGGLIDELEIFNVAVNDNDVQDIYDSGTAGKCKPPVSTPTLPHYNGLCSVIPLGTASGDAFCGTNNTWGIDLKATGKAFLKSIGWPLGTGELPQNCCNATSCWTGQPGLNALGKIYDGCQNDQLQINDPETNYQGYRCEGGNWIKRTKRYTWDYSASGYCPTETQCLVSPSGNATSNNEPGLYYSTSQPQPQCIESGQYLTKYTSPQGEYYCESGIWSTRTKQIALHLLNYTNEISPTEYRLFCGTAHETLNQPAVLSNYISSTSCSNGTRGVPCVNNFCVLETPQGIAWGVSLNNRVNDESKSFLSNPQGLNINPPTACDNALSGTGYTQCSGDERLWYNPELNSLLFIPAGEVKPFSLLDFFEGFIEAPLDTLKDFVFDRLHNPDSPGNDFSFFNNTHAFGKIYAAREGSQRIFAFYEQNIQVTESKKADYLGILYENVDLGSDPCTTLLKTDITNAPRAGVACSSTPNQINIITDVHQISPSAPNTINAVWRDLTAKLRPGE